MDDVTRRRVLLVAVVMTLVVLAGIGFARGRDDSPPARTQPDQARPHRVHVDRRDLTAATMQVVGGTDGLTIVGADLDGELVEAQTPDGTLVVPYVQRAGSTVTVGTRDQGKSGGGPALLSVRLSRAVTWTVRSSGGTAHLQVQMQGADLRALSVDAGVSALELTVGRPRGTTDVRVSGGASSVRVQVPAGTPTRYTFTGGAGSAVVGSQRRGGLPGGSVITSPGFGSAVDRVDVHLDAGIGSLTADA